MTDAGHPRHLTPESKAVILEEWERKKLELVPPSGSDPGGLGFPDPAIFETCDRLNAIEGVCTLQSCSGHWSPEYAGDDGRPTRCPQPGGLWLWLSEPMLCAFHAAVDLRSSPLIERVQLIYHSGGQDIVDIDFAGQAHGQLAESTDLIVAFFQKLADQSVDPPVVWRRGYRVVDGTTVETEEALITRAQFRAALHENHHAEVEACIAKIQDDWDTMLDANITERDTANARTATLQVRLDELCVAWDAFDVELIGQTPGRMDTGEGKVFFQETPAGWQAYHHIDRLVADWQLREATTPVPRPVQVAATPGNERREGVGTTDVSP